MKKNFKLAFVVLAAICFGQQVKAQTTGEATINIDLTKDIISLKMEASPVVNFVYESEEDYKTLQTQPKPGHFTVFSNKSYTIAVNANDEFSSAGVTEHPALSVIAVAVTNPAGHSPVTALTLDPQTLVNSSPATIGQSFDVNYSISEENSKTLVSLPQKIYTTTVTYTATQL